MRALLSAVGTRGDVQPILALAVELRMLGHDARLCVPPNFVQWVEARGFEALPVGVEMRQQGARNVPLSQEELRRMRESLPDLITDQFDKVGAAADGCDAILGANAHQYAARSIAEQRGLPYVTALYAPVALPSPDHAPPPLPGARWQRGSAQENLERWADDALAWNARALERVNNNRARLGQPAIDDVRGFNITARPWLAADPILAPIPSTPNLDVFETGAWILEDSAALPPQLEAFLAAGEPPVYLGFGSMPVADALGPVLVDAVRTVGLRALVSRGWAGLRLADDAPDCLAIDDVNHQALLPRVAAIVHHGGAGTSAAAARAAVPQVVRPLYGDQFYWAERVSTLGTGTRSVGDATSDGLANALRQVIQPQVRARCRDLARQLAPNGALVAARKLIELSS